MLVSRRIVVCAGLLLLPGVALTSAPWFVPAAVRAQTPPARVEFARDVQPLLRANCVGCHGPALQSGNFRIDRRRDVMPNRVGANGARIVPGNSAASRVFARISGPGAGVQMPPTGALKPEEIALIKAWIEQGADWPDALSGDAPAPPQNPHAAELMDALRSGDRRVVDRLLRTHPDAVRSKGTGGSTALMYAALYADAATVRLLLDRGADPNARNDAGATALMWAVDDAEKTRVLLARRADPNLRSDDGQTALILAANRFGAIEIVKALLDAGATLKGQGIFGRAGAAGDEAVMRLVLDRGAETDVVARDVNRTMRSNCAGCVDLLLASATPRMLNDALAEAAKMGDSRRVQGLLERGAEPTGDALRQLAASERLPAEAVKLLLDRGVRDERALELALAQGDSPVVAALKTAGVSESAPRRSETTRLAAQRSPRAAVEQVLPKLQHAHNVFLKKAGCVSCHNNSLFQMTAATARPRGFRVDEQAEAVQQQAIAAYIESWRERALQDIPIPGGVDTISYTLAGLAAAGYPPDAATDALARYLERRQAPDGGWIVATNRPPIESSSVAVTALVIRALQAFAPSSQQPRYAASSRRAAAWLRQVHPETTEDHVFRVLGLVWARDDRRVIRDAARELAALQRADGGWSQLPTLTSDAYATGQALTALAESGLSAETPVYQRGTRFLLDNQLDDGSWRIRSRAFPIQPYFDSEFPHARDQFISAAASNWAVMALMRAAR